MAVRCSDGHVLLVRNLDAKVTARDLGLRVFQDAGDILKINVHTDDNDKPTGTAEIIFATEVCCVSISNCVSFAHVAVELQAEAEAALRKHSGQVVNGELLCSSLHTDCLIWCVLAGKPIRLSLAGVEKLPVSVSVTARAPSSIVDCC